jgi:hypothetical protein
MSSWKTGTAFFLPPGAPPQTQAKLEKALFAVLQVPSVKGARFAANGMHGTLGSEHSRPGCRKSLPLASDNQSSASPENNGQSKAAVSA